jgi:flagellar L-ring protein precursor FlgH
MVGVGDLITILVDEYTLASANQTQAASRQKARDLGLKAGSAGTMSGGGLESTNDVADRTLGESSRSQRFSAEVSARIMEITPSGMARVEGRRRLTIDNHEQEVTIRGWLRVQDLTTQNTVESWRIADAEILYTSNGKLAKAGGLWSTLINIIWP